MRWDYLDLLTPAITQHRSWSAWYEAESDYHKIGIVLWSLELSYRKWSWYTQDPAKCLQQRSERVGLPKRLTGFGTQCK